MHLTTLTPAIGSKREKKRVGRGIGSGIGKTAGRGHKGQKSRAGGFHKTGFEGGQMPIQRRLPKRGFSSLTKQLWQSIRTGDLKSIQGDLVDIATLKSENLVGHQTKKVRLFFSGELLKPMIIAKEIIVSRGARSAIEKHGGKILEG